MADSSDLSALPPQIFALLVGTTSVRPLWVQLRNIQLLSVAVSKKVEKKKCTFTYSAHNLFFLPRVSMHTAPYCLGVCT